MFLRSERGGGRGLESFPVEGAEGAGEDRGHGEQPERREGAEHEREQQQHRQAAGPGLRCSAAPGPGIGADAVEDGEQGGAVAEVVGEGSAQRPGVVAPLAGHRPDGVDD